MRGSIVNKAENKRLIESIVDTSLTLPLRVSSWKDTRKIWQKSGCPLRRHVHISTIRNACAGLVWYEPTPSIPEHVLASPVSWSLAAVMEGRDFSLSNVSKRVLSSSASSPPPARCSQRPRAALTPCSILVKLQEYEDLSLRGELGELPSDESDFQCEGNDIHD